MAKFINVKGFPLIFVQNAAGDSFTVYQDGKEVRGIRSIRIDAGVEEFTTHEIEYVTGATAEERWEGSGEMSGWKFEDSSPRTFPKKQSANERRKQAIEKAEKFVADTQGTVKNDHPTDRGNDVYKRHRTVSEFVVNEEKRTVVALIRYNGFPEDDPIAKGIAKCAPTDVFNEHIGKAIALGRAYGLDVSEFEQAPQPDEVEVGMKVETLMMTTGESTGIISKVVEVREDGYPQFSIGYASHYRIISDTEAQY